MSRFKEAFKKFSLGAIRVGVGVGLVFIFKTLGLGWALPLALPVFAFSHFIKVCINVEKLTPSKFKRAFLTFLGSSVSLIVVPYAPDILSIVSTILPNVEIPQYIVSGVKRCYEAVLKLVDRFGDVKLLSVTYSTWLTLESRTNWYDFILRYNGCRPGQENALVPYKVKPTWLKIVVNVSTACGLVVVSCVGADLLNTVWPDEFSNQFVKGVFKFAKHVLKDSDSILYIASTTVSGVAAAEVLHVSSNSRECFENGTTKELAGCCAATTVHGQSVAALFLLANS